MDKLRAAYKEHPILLPTGFAWYENEGSTPCASLIITSVFISFLFLGYVNYVYFVQQKAMHNFPEPVAKELRKAIYYDKGYGKDPKKAFQYYKEALMVATDLGMNPYSEEFIGMRMRMAEFLEQNNQYEGAITVLEKERDLCYDFLERSKATKEIEIPDAQWSRMTGMAVKLGVKLGKLYSDEEVDNPEAAQEALVQAVETLLKERIRRQEEGIKEDGQKWLNEEEIGATLEELGHSYLDTNQPEFALPLFLQALSLSPSSSCHSAMLSECRHHWTAIDCADSHIVNQISAALSLQRPGSAPVLDASNSKTTGPSAAELQKQAKQWAEKALAMAQAVPPPNRTDECDIACAVTTHNLAELAHISGDDIAAKKLFQEAKTLSEAMGFEDGVKEAAAALQRLQGPVKA